MKKSLLLHGGWLLVAISGYSGKVAWQDPRAAMDSASVITSEEARVEAMVGIAHAWKRRDAAGAVEWANTSELPEPVRRVILGSPQVDRPK